MKKTTRFAIIFSFFTFAINTFSQVGIGTTNPLPGTSLQIDGTDSGVLINRVALSGTDDVATVASLGATQEGLMVYNTNESSNVNPETDVVPGFYYWSGTKWVAVSENSKKKTGWVALTDGDYSLTLPGITLANSTNSANFTNVNLNFTNSGSDNIIESFAPTGYVANDFFDSTTHRITPIAIGDAVEIRLQFNAIPDANNSFIVVALDIGSPSGIVVFQKTVPLLRGSGDLNRISESILLYQLGTFFANGAILRLGYASTSGSPGNVSLSNFNLVISRITAGN